MRRRAIQAGEDRGVTLIELLIAIMLVGFVMSALVTAMILVLETTDATRQKVTDTSGAQLLTSVLVSDVQSSDSVQPSAGCGGAPILELSWTDANDTAGRTDVQYVTEPTGDGNDQLVRNVYHVDGSCTLTDTTVVVRAVDAANVTPVCDPACDDTAIEVGLDVTALSKDPTGDFYSPYEFSVSGVRRTQ